MTTKNYVQLGNGQRISKTECERLKKRFADDVF